MKRSYTAAQLRYPKQWRAAKVRRVGSALTDIKTQALTADQYIATQEIAKQSIKRSKAREADKHVTKIGNYQQEIGSAGFVVSLLANLVRGDSPIQYEGEKIRPTYIEVNMLIDLTGLQNGTYESLDTIRLWVVQTSTATTTGQQTTYPYYFTGIANSSGRPFDTVNWDNRKNFRILRDSGPIVFSNVTGHANCNGSAAPFRFKINANELRSVFFNQSGGVEKNDIFLVAVTDSSLTPYPLLTWNAHVEFTDN